MTFLLAVDASSREPFFDEVKYPVSQSDGEEFVAWITLSHSGKLALMETDKSVNSTGEAEPAWRILLDRCIHRPDST
jgi:hypothetical protein